MAAGAVIVFKTLKLFQVIAAASIVHAPSKRSVLPVVVTVPAVYVKVPDDLLTFPGIVIVPVVFICKSLRIPVELVVSAIASDHVPVP